MTTKAYKILVAILIAFIIFCFFIMEKQKVKIRSANTTSKTLLYMLTNKENCDNYIPANASKIDVSTLSLDMSEIEELTKVSNDQDKEAQKMLRKLVYILNTDHTSF